jgi:hypothetical protein
VLRNEDADEDNTHTLMERDKSPDAISPTHDVKHINHDDPKCETIKSRRRNAVNRNKQDTKNEKPTVLYGTGKAALNLQQFEGHCAANGYTLDES